MSGLLLLLLVVLTVGVAACGAGENVGDAGTVSTTEGSQPTVTSSDESSTTSSTATSSTETTQTSVTSTTSIPDGESMQVRVYYSRDEMMSAHTRVVPKTDSVGAAAMKALLEGPTQTERDADVVTNIPEGTTFLGLSIDDGIATVDLSQEYASGGGSFSMAMRLAEVVFTLTQFPTVDGVNFMLDGKPVEVFGGEGIILDHPLGRDDYEGFSPAILVESPTLGETISSPVRITGTANTFEATFQLNITDWDGRIVYDEVVTATSGTGTRGTFDVTASFDVDRSGPGSIIAFVYSARDGSQENVIEIPVYIEK